MSSAYSVYLTASLVPFLGRNTLAIVVDSTFRGPEWKRSFPPTFVSIVPVLPLPTIQLFIIRFKIGPTLSSDPHGNFGVSFCKTPFETFRCVFEVSVSQIIGLGSVSSFRVLIFGHSALAFGYVH